MNWQHCLPLAPPVISATLPASPAMSLNGVSRRAWRLRTLAGLYGHCDRTDGGCGAAVKCQAPCCLRGFGRRRRRRAGHVDAATCAGVPMLPPSSLRGTTLAAHQGPAALQADPSAPWPSGWLPCCCSPSLPRAQQARSWPLERPARLRTLSRHRPAAAAAPLKQRSPHAHRPAGMAGTLNDPMDLAAAAPAQELFQFGARHPPVGGRSMAAFQPEGPSSGSPTQPSPSTSPSPSTRWSPRLTPRGARACTS